MTSSTANSTNSSSVHYQFDIEYSVGEKIKKLYPNSGEQFKVEVNETLYYKVYVDMNASNVTIMT